MRGTEQQFQPGLVRQVGWRGNLVTILHPSLPSPHIRWFVMLALVMLILLCITSGVLADDPSNVTSAQLSTIMEKRGLPVEGVTLTAILQQNAVTPGMQAIMYLTIHNESKQSRYFDASQSVIDYFVIVQDSNGQLLQLKKLPRLTISANIVGPALLAPNEESSTIYPLSLAFDLRKVGIYRITAMRKVFTSIDRLDPYEVVSNTIILKVSDHLVKDITLTSALAKPSVEIDQPIALSLTLKNTSKKPKTLTAKDLSDDYTVTVQDFRGEVMLPDNKEKVAVDEIAVDRVLQPDETVAVNIDMAKLYDLHKKGRYFITTSHNVTDDKGQVMQVYSNTTVLTVTKTPPPAADMPLAPIMKKRGLPVEGN